MIFNIKDYGAVGDGITDDKAAIQAAVNAARAAGGGEVYIPTGTYAVTGNSKASLGAIMLYDNVTVYGDGMGQSVVRVKDGWSGDITGIFRTPYGVESHDIGMHDLTVDGNRAHVTGKIDGWFNGVTPGGTGADQNITLDHVEIMNASGYGFDPHERTINLKITNSVSHGNGLDGFAIDYQINAYIANNVAYNNDRHGFNVVTTTHDSTLADNVAYSNGYDGIVVQRGSDNVPVPTNIIITGGEYYNNAHNGIELNKADNVHIDDVTIHDNAQRGIRLLGSTDSEVVNSNIHDNSQSKNGGYEEISIASYDDTAGVSGKMYLSTGNQISNNTISDSGAIQASYGVRELADGSDYNSVYNNTISGAKFKPLLLTGAHTTTEAPPPPPPPPVDEGTLVAKANWWHQLSSYYHFTDSTSTQVGSITLLKTLHDYGAGHLTDLLQPAFLSGAHVLADPLLPDRSNVVVANPGFADFVNGGKGLDYLAGNDGDDILFGGSGNDIFNPGSGMDLIIGGDGPGTHTERDTVTYLMAASGIVMEPETTFSAGSTPPLIYDHQYVYTYNDWVAKANSRINGFKVGNGGDVLDVSDMLQHVGYHGTDPIADGYIRLRAVSDGLKIQFDPDGTGGVSPTVLVTLTGVDINTFDVAHNLAFKPIPVVPEELTLVSNDGNGGYDVLYSVENVFGSDFNDVLHGQSTVDNALFGGLGNDTIYGEGGKDTLSGGDGTNKVYGGTGNDLLLIGSGTDTLNGGDGQDVFKFEGSSVHNLHASIIEDFQTGVGGDKLDVSELLTAVGYHGTDAVKDGYIRITQITGGTKIQFDADGIGGASPASLVTLKNVQPSAFSIADNLVTHSSSILYAAILGQSNASGLAIEGGDHVSGLNTIKDGILAHTDFTRVETMTRDESNYYVPIAVGGTSVDGDENDPLSKIWWYPAENKPADLLVRAVDMMAIQMADLRAQGDVTPVIIWGQGEAEANRIGGITTEAGRMAAEQAYMDETRAVFNYIQNRLGHDIDFYIMQTGRYQVDGALASNHSQTSIDRTVHGLDYVHDAQELLALNNKDIHLAVNYSDLPLKAEAPSDSPGYDSTWPQDAWHLSYESREVVGARIADFISLDLGYSQVLDDPGAYPLRMLADLDLKAGAGLTITGNDHNNIVVGTLGQDTIHGGNGNDVIFGGPGHDVLYGDAGSDIFYYDVATFKEIEAPHSPAINLSDVISDFTPGNGGDVIDISAILEAGGYTGSNPVADQYVRVAQQGADTIISIDQDGTGTAHGFVAIAQLTNTDASLFDPAHNLNIKDQAAMV